MQSLNLMVDAVRAGKTGCLLGRLIHAKLDNFCEFTVGLTIATELHERLFVRLKARKCKLNFRTKILNLPTSK